MEIKNKEKVYIVVDLENTLIDTSEFLVNLILKSLNDQGKTESKRKIRRYLYDFDMITKPLKIDQKKFWESIRKYDNRIKGVNDGTIHLYKDTIKFLKFASNYNLILLTDVEKENALPILNKLKIMSYFDIIECAKGHIMNISKFKKPDPYFVEYALKQLNYKFGNIIYVGDSKSDLLLTQNMKKKDLNNIFILIKRYSNIKGDITVKSLSQAIKRIKGILKNKS